MMVRICVLLVIAARLLVLSSATPGSVDVSTSDGFAWYEYGWRRGDLASPNHVMNFAIALKQKSTSQELHNKLMTVADPRSPLYGQYYSVDALADIVAPPPEDINTVLDFVKDRCPDAKIELLRTRDIAEVELPLSQLEALFEHPRPKFHSYFHIHGKIETVRTLDRLWLRREIASLIDVLVDVDDFPRVKFTRPHPQRPRVGTNAECTVRGYQPYSGSIHVSVSLPPSGSEYIWFEWAVDQAHNHTVQQAIKLGQHTIGKGFNVFVPNYQLGYIRCGYQGSSGSPVFGKFFDAPIVTHDLASPVFLRKYYGVPTSLVGSASSKSNQSIFEPFHSRYSPGAVRSYWDTWGVPADNSSVYLTTDKTRIEMGTEQALDVQAMTGMAPNFTTNFNNQLSSSVIIWAGRIAADPNAVLVHSSSFGVPKNLPCSNKIIVRAEEELKKAGMRGVTMISATGDFGSFSFFGQVNCSRVIPGYPESSPYILSVGATRFAMGEQEPVCHQKWEDQPTNSPLLCGATGEQPVAVDSGATFTTTGSFAYCFPQPSWQVPFVRQYFASVNQSELPPPTAYNASGRGFADVSALGSGYIIATSPNEYTWTGGTSAAAPLTGGMITVLNHYLLEMNKPALGLVAPLLYQLRTTNPEVFNPIYHGNTRCTAGTLSACCEKGFPSAASSDWNPAGGLGSLNVGNFIQYLQNH